MVASLQRFTPHPLLMVIVSVACIASQMAGPFHALAVRHETCPSHGDLIDVPGIAVAGDRPIEPSRDSVGPRTTEEGEHDHCNVTLHRRSALIVSASSRVAPDSNEQHHTPRARDFIAPAVARYRLAPKQSPPVS